MDVLFVVLLFGSVFAGLRLIESRHPVYEKDGSLDRFSSNAFAGATLFGSTIIFLGYHYG